MLQLFISLGAIVAGIGYIIEPSGKNLDMTIDLLKNSPFDDYLIPGIVLLVINGIGSLIGSVLSYIKHRNAGIVGILLGIALIIWIIAQVYWIGLISWLQPFYLVLGILELILGYFLLRTRSEIFSLLRLPRKGKDD